MLRGNDSMPTSSTAAGAEAHESNRIKVHDVSFSTATWFNVAALGVVLVLTALYSIRW
jgi:hypothetical protein